MDRIPSVPPLIEPLSDSVSRPRWSVMIPAYNCSGQLHETLASVLSQAPGPEQMQIEVVDDASTDADVGALVERIGRGRVGYYRQEQNVGSLRNFETCLKRSRGHLVHLLHGDDRVLPGFYEKLDELFRRFPEAGAAFCRYRHIDPEGRPLGDEPSERESDGLLEGWLDRIAAHQRLQYVCMVVRRSVYERLGGFYGVTYGEDWEMWVRIARHFPVAYSPRTLAEYRVHGTSISSEKILSGQNLRDLRFVMEAIQNHLPPDKRKEVLARSRRIWAHYSIQVARQIWQETHNPRGVNAQVREILRLHTDPNLYWKVAKLYGRLALDHLRSGGFYRPR
ncbi:glycosyltransferase family 2 protein [Larkinella soli]|uniref:glycosyltransferase family 2 protein n=1 Tax=Larkinella soli TaxID=1770527 RepID=UPI000FFB9DF6|nr:glycosyltransferase [Larkinella soli]